MEQVLTFLGVPSVIGVLVLIIKFIALIRTSKFERLLMNDQRNLTITIIESTLTAIILAIVATYWTAVFNQDEQIEFYIALFLVFFILSISAMPSIFGVVNIVRKKSLHFIKIPPTDTNTEGKLYILKVTLDNKVVLSNKKSIKDITGIKVIKEFEYIIGQEIFEEPLH